MINYLSKFNYLSIKLITCQNKLIADQKMIDYRGQSPHNTATDVALYRSGCTEVVNTMYRSGMYRRGTLLTRTEIVHVPKWSKFRICRKTCTEMVMYRSDPNPSVASCLLHVVSYVQLASFNVYRRCDGGFNLNVKIIIAPFETYFLTYLSLRNVSRDILAGTKRHCLYLKTDIYTIVKSVPRTAVREMQVLRLVRTGYATEVDRTRV